MSKFGRDPVWCVDVSSGQTTGSTPAGFATTLHYGYTDGRNTILRYDNENETVGRHERHDADGVDRIEFPGMMELRERFLDEIEDLP